MQIAVISDLHLGRGDSTDLFNHTHSSFLRFLNYLEGNFERIILLGDIYETLGGLPGRQRRELGLIQEAHQPLVARFNRPQYTTVYGNHDMVTSKLGASEEIMLESDGVRMLFQHGHTYDWFIRHLRRFPEFLVWVGFYLARNGLKFFFRLGEKIDMWSRQRDGLKSFRQWAFGEAEKKKADVIVTAHTHTGGVVRHQDGHRLYLNSGTCSKGKLSWLSLDTKNGSYHYHINW